MTCNISDILIPKYTIWKTNLKYCFWYADEGNYAITSYKLTVLLTAAEMNIWKVLNKSVVPTYENGGLLFYGPLW